MPDPALSSGIECLISGMPDTKEEYCTQEKIKWYRVRKSWADSKGQKGAYKILDNAKKCADQNPGYKVFDTDGNVVYEPKAAESAEKALFLVKVGISDLNIRKGPGTDYGRVKFIPVGVYTIVEVKDGKGSEAGWGRLKSGAGWIDRVGVCGESVRLTAGGDEGFCRPSFCNYKKMDTMIGARALRRTIYIVPFDVVCIRLLTILFYL